MGLRCVFGCLVAFVALVGLYACSVRRLESEKRHAAYFLGFIGLLRSCGCFAWFVLLLLRSCCLCALLVLVVWVVLLVALFPYRAV